MTNYFTHYWKNDTWYNEADDLNRYLTNTASNLFRDRGVQIGDYVYVVTVINGILYAAARLRVDHLVGQDEAKRILSTHDIWEAEDHVISDEPPLANYNCKIPDSAYPELYFDTSKGARPPHIIAGGLLDQQTLRGVRRLTPEGAMVLDRYMKDCESSIR